MQSDRVPAPDVAGLDRLLDELFDENAGACGLSAQYLQQIRSCWRSVRTTLDLPATTPLTDLDPDTLLERFVATRGPGFRAVTTYKSRLRKAIDLFQAQLSGDPDWRDQRLGRGIQPIVATAPADTRVVVFPLRPDLTIAVELPHDLRVREAQPLSLWLTSMAR